MPLPLPWVDRIFERLIVRFGHDFLRRWDGLEIETVKADWAHELDGLDANPAAIAYGLEHLPADKPPTVAQFRALCNGRPEPRMAALPAPVSQPSPEVLAKVANLSTHAHEHPRAWAERLREREQRSRGQGLTRAQREMWRTALGVTQ